MTPTPHATAHDGSAQRLTFGVFVHELQHYLHLDKGLPHTLVDLLLRPGAMLRGYFDGTRRREYTNPIAYSLMAAALALLVFGLYREAFVAWMRVQFDAASVGGHPTGFAQAYLEHVLAASQRTAVTSLLLAVPHALLVWRAFRGPRFNLAEAFAFALYSIGTFLFVHAIVVGPVVYLTHAWTFAQWAGNALQLGVPLWLGIGLFGAGVRNVVKLLVALGLSMLVGYLAFAVCLLAYTAATYHPGA